MALQQADQTGFQAALVTVAVAGLGDVIDQVQQGGGFIIERRAERQLVGILGAQPPAQVVKFARSGQRGGGEDHGRFLSPQVLRRINAPICSGASWMESWYVVGLDFYPIHLILGWLEYQGVQVVVHFKKPPVEVGQPTVNFLIFFGQRILDFRHRPTCRYSPPAGAGSARPSSQAASTSPQAGCVRVASMMRSW